MQKIDIFLSQLQDGNWHSLKEVAKDSGIPKKRLATLSKLLARPNIIEYRSKKSQVKIKKSWQRLLENTDVEESGTKAAVGSIILPPEGTIRVQGVRMTNLLETEIEMNVRVGKKLEEIALGLVERD